MAEMQMEQFQRELNVLAQKLHEKEQQLSALTHQGQSQVSQMQAQLQEVLQKLENREQEIVQLQIQMAETPEFQDTTPEIKNDFACGRVPDIIKGLPQYSGSAHQLSTWIQSVERILKHFDSLKNTDIYQLWLQEIRNKIVGEAGDMLASNGIPLDWPSIKAQLTLLYGDKRELSTLLQKLFALKQERFSVNDFYSSIRDCFTGISTHIQTSQEWERPAEIVRFVDKLCLEKFIDGLDEPYATHVGLMQPTTLNQAFQHAIEKANKIARKTGIYDVGKTQPKPVLPPRNMFLNNNSRLPPQPNIFRQPQQHVKTYQTFPQHRPQFNKPMLNQGNPRPMNNFQPYRQFNPQPNRQPYFPPNNPQQQYFQQNNAQKPFQFPKFQPNSPPYRTPQPNPIPRAEPMDVDRSLRSRNINYMNRPNYQVVEDDQNEYNDYNQYTDCNYYHNQYSDNQYPDVTENLNQDANAIPDQQPEPNVHTDVTVDDLNFQLDTATQLVT